MYLPVILKSIQSGILTSCLNDHRLFQNSERGNYYFMTIKVSAKKIYRLSKNFVTNDVLQGFRVFRTVLDFCNSGIIGTVLFSCFFTCIRILRENQTTSDFL